MELAPIQKDILIALINLQREKDRAVKGEEIADLINRNPGTVRNQMQSLKVMGHKEYRGFKMITFCTLTSIFFCHNKEHPIN